MYAALLRRAVSGTDPPRHSCKAAHAHTARAVMHNICATYVHTRLYMHMWGDSLVVELELSRLDKGRAPLVRHVVDDKHGAAVRHLAVVAVVGLGGAGVCACVRVRV